VVMITTTTVAATATTWTSSLGLRLVCCTRLRGGCFFFAADRAWLLQPRMQVPVVLVIAGSDSSGGAGIQADIRTMASMGVHAATAITAVTTQTSGQLRGVVMISTASVIDQCNAAMAELPIAAVKVGMLGSSDMARSVGTWLQQRASSLPVVVDPVMTSSSGGSLVDDDIVDALQAAVLPHTTVLTPNLDEAARFAGHAIHGVEQQTLLAQRLCAQLRPHTHRGVVVKGGHGPGDPIDVLVGDSVEGERMCLRARRIDSVHTRGTGCSMASSIAAALAHGSSLVDAVRSAHAYVRQAILHAPHTGAARGPLQHFPHGRTWHAPLTSTLAVAQRSHADLEHTPFMAQAMEQARLAASVGEVPVGAVVVHNGIVVARAHNLREHNHDPAGHAELIAMREAAQQLGRWRLDDCTLYVTLEPCFMCAGAVVQARVGRVVFGARDARGGAMMSLGHVGSDPRLNHQCTVDEGLMGDESKRLLQGFFATKRGA
jgi:hydroxymethylpyrimidine/phosphomethylpyrimidine kinase